MVLKISVFILKNFLGFFMRIYVFCRFCHRKFRLWLGKTKPFRARIPILADTNLISFKVILSCIAPHSATLVLFILQFHEQTQWHQVAIWSNAEITTSIPGAFPVRLPDNDIWTLHHKIHFWCDELWENAITWSLPESAWRVDHSHSPFVCNGGDKLKTRLWPAPVGYSIVSANVKNTGFWLGSEEEACEINSGSL